MIGRILDGDGWLEGGVSLAKEDGWDLVEYSWDRETGWATCLYEKNGDEFSAVTVMIHQPKWVAPKETDAPSNRRKPIRRGNRKEQAIFEGVPA